MKLILEIESIGDVREAREALHALLDAGGPTAPKATVKSRTTDRHPGTNGDAEWAVRAAAAVNTHTTVQKPSSRVIVDGLSGESILETPDLFQGKPELAYSKEQMKNAGQINPKILELLKLRGRKTDERILELNCLTAEALQDIPDHPDLPLGEVLAGATAMDLQQEMSDAAEADEPDTDGEEGEDDEASEQPLTAQTLAETSVAALFNADAGAPTPAAADAAKLRAEVNAYALSLGLHEGIKWFNALKDVKGPIENLEPGFMVELLANPGMVFQK